MRGVALVVALICGALMVVLLFKSPSADFEPGGEDGQVHVSCSPVIRAGWPSDFSGLQPEDGWDHFQDHVDGDASLSFPQRAGIAQDCNERRDTYLAFVAILGVLTSLSGAAALRRRPA